MLPFYGIAVCVLDFIAIISVLGGRGSLEHKSLWGFLILSLPVVGILMYYWLDRSPVNA